MKTLVLSIVNVISVTICYGVSYQFEGGSVAHILIVEPYVDGNYTLNERIVFINTNTNSQKVWDVDTINMEASLLSFESYQPQKETREYIIKCDPGGFFGTDPFDLPVTVDMNTSSYDSNEILVPFSISQGTLRSDVGYEKNVLH